MKKWIYIPSLLLILFQSEGMAMEENNYNKLTAAEKRVILHKGTEPRFSGEYTSFSKEGTYLCKQCNAPLYESSDKFKSNCGWPSFDDEIPGAVRREPDADGRRIEILCANCDGHLGHVFEGERFTDKNIRHCVNSISLTFEPKEAIASTAKAYFAGGCFWGVEYLFEKQDGVISATSGYMGGANDQPTYKEVCSGQSGHIETVEVTYNPALVSYETLAKLFFEIHDPTQANGQGPDIGSQYVSAIFYETEAEKKKAEELIELLKSNGYDVVTQLIPAPAHTFWEAEEYHQNYYVRTKKQPYCHRYQKRF